MKAVVYLLDTSIWSGFKDTNMSKKVMFCIAILCNV